MTLIEEIAAWRDARCAESCPRCPRNCCTGRLNPRLDPPVGGRGGADRFASLPVVRGPLDPRPASGPYVVERGFPRQRFLVGHCPHLAQGRCGIYADPGRPTECREYPVHVQRVLAGLLGTVIHVERSCWIFDSPEAVEEVRGIAGRHGVECLVHDERSP